MLVLMVDTKQESGRILPRVVPKAPQERDFLENGEELARETINGGG
jgi:hypothetical protein